MSSCFEAISGAGFHSLDSRYGCRLLLDAVQAVIDPVDVPLKGAPHDKSWNIFGLTVCEAYASRVEPAHVAGRDR